MTREELANLQLKPTWNWSGELSNLVGAAVHDGHELRDEIAACMKLNELGRQREEDPFTGEMAQVLPFRVVGTQSRFEVDFNRPRDKAVYRVPDDCWGLEVWDGELEEGICNRSLALYDAFYVEAQRNLQRVTEEFGAFVLYDLHTYNHRRDGANSPPASAEENPEVNIGTRTALDEKFRPIVERFIADLREFDFGGRRLDVRENVKFGGGEFSKWVHRTFPANSCSIAIEWKKFWMDEWSGEVEREQLDLICLALEATLPGVREELERL